MFILLVLAYLLVGCAEVFLWETKDIRKIGLFGTLLIGSLILSALMLLGVDIPSPTGFFEKLILSLS